MSNNEVYIHINEIEADVLETHYQNSLLDIAQDIKRNGKKDPHLIKLIRTVAERYESLLIKTGKLKEKTEF